MAFSPTDIAGIKAWWNAGVVSGNDGDSVTALLDQGGVGYDLSEVSAGQDPVLKKTVNGINGQNVLRFDGVDDILRRASTGIIRNVSIATFFIVLKPANTSQDGTASMFFSIAGVGTRAGLFTGHGSDGKYNIGGRRLDADSAQLLAGNAFTTAATLVTAIFDWANTTLTLYENGTQTAQSTSFQTAGSTEDTASTLVALGATDTAGTSPFAGDIAEVAIYGTVSAADRNSFGGYIQNKYAITIAGATFQDLPCGRPMVMVF